MDGTAVEIALSHPRKYSMLVLGIESSCDETAAAVVRYEEGAAGRVLSDVVRSQIEAHAPFGGVVPEIAARDHLRAIMPVVESALKDANLELDAIDGIAATRCPGLVGALLVGLQTAKAMAWTANKPLVGVDHLVGHLLSVFLQRPDEAPPDVCFPYIGLLVSGGHTALYRVDGTNLDDIKELGATRDDAVGEAFDKVAKMLGLGYPGGPIVDRLAQKGQRENCPLELKTALSGSLEMSFSGIKSAMARHVAQAGEMSDQTVADLCAQFQYLVVRTLAKKTLRAARQEDLKAVALAGGVAANSELRSTMQKACDHYGLRLHVPAFRSCTDNAAMIAYAGAVRLAKGERDGLDMSPEPRTSLARVTRKGRGKR
jgi:N6-L-threonylcarbamoyladenine synthase